MLIIQLMQLTNTKFSCNFRLISLFAFCFLSFRLLIFSTAISIFSTSVFFSQDLLELPSCQLGISKIKHYLFFQIKSERVSRSVLSLLSAEELLALVCFDFSELQVDLHVFCQLAIPSLTRNFSLCFQLCFDFAMYHGSLCCPFKRSQKKRKDSLETRVELAVLRAYVENQAILEPILLYRASKFKQTKEQGSEYCLQILIFTFL